jgi:hypothetical protein
MHILNLIHQSYIQHYLHMLEKTPLTLWFVIFINNPLSPKLSNNIVSQIDESNLIYAPCTPDMLFFSKLQL